jgi:hypothetical protein
MNRWENFRIELSKVVEQLSVALFCRMNRTVYHRTYSQQLFSRYLLIGSNKLESLFLSLISNQEEYNTLAYWTH